eukprot:TRINITY_DN94799_c0_g1_i1.p1 TRINITY_DN94799_c0_g1~~TRINITY_DN94799_c0_g1_i1.p1  ORF type:complete len:338 (-),score=42.55 TRINITY_DN94799_c0_g1_i1:68-1081(-)
MAHSSLHASSAQTRGSLSSTTAPHLPLYLHSSHYDTSSLSISPASILHGHFATTQVSSSSQPATPSSVMTQLPFPLRVFHQHAGHGDLVILPPRLAPTSRNDPGTPGSWASNGTTHFFRAVHPAQLLRPSRVVLMAPDGSKSLCLVKDCAARLQQVGFGLPAGRRLGPEGEECAICLETLKTGDTVQPMAQCQHLFHVTCIQSFLKKLPVTQRAACPLCRGPLAAADISDVPRREQDLVTSLRVPSRQCGIMANSATMTHLADADLTPSSCTSRRLTSQDSMMMTTAENESEGTCDTQQYCRKRLLHAATASVEQVEGHRLPVLRHAATVPLPCMPE